MDNKRSIGILEVQNYGNALICCDLISKSGNVDLIFNKNNLGGRLVTLVFKGNVSDLYSSFDNIKKHFIDTKLLKVCEVIPNPTKEIISFFNEGEFKNG